jgi:Tfp pilus assembly protein PilO
LEVTDKLMFFRKRQQIVILILAAMLVADFALFGYLPLRERMKDVEQKRALQALGIAKASAQNAQLLALKGQLAELGRTVGNYELQVPQERALGAFLHRIADLMDEHNLGERLIQPGKEIRAEELNCIPVRMQCEGRLEEIFEFFKSLQSLDRLVRVEQVRLVNDRDFNGMVSMETSAVVYYRPDAEQG